MPLLLYLFYVAGRKLQSTRVPTSGAMQISSRRPVSAPAANRIPASSAARIFPKKSSGRLSSPHMTKVIVKVPAKVAAAQRLKSPSSNRAARLISPTGRLRISNSQAAKVSVAASVDSSNAKSRPLSVSRAAHSAAAVSSLLSAEGHSSRSTLNRPASAPGSRSAQFVYHRKGNKLASIPLAAVSRDT